MSIELHAFWAVMGIVGIFLTMILSITWKNEPIDKSTIYWVIVALLVTNFLHLWLTDETARLIITVQ